ncbi:MAG: precorrin-2 C(20)-methyltransferase [Rhodobacteraceae bacterium]|nr:precorrin-2 C(20)-methyltransferase [Paracoccaceae bacterium]|tara:strand:- start:286 stop:987 length:702 start_codon:yes stop_codon:yes gene_type:complete
MNGVLYGVGVGPGDPELITLKSLRLIKSTEVIAYPKLKGSKSFARNIIEEFIDLPKVEIAIEIPMTVNRLPAQRAYDAAAQKISTHLNMGENVVFLCEGDPFFYGSFMYMHSRLYKKYLVEIIPGVSSMTACAAMAKKPLAARNEVLTVLPGPLSKKELERRLADNNSSAIMKVGRHIKKIKSVIDRLGLMDSSLYIERASLKEQKVLKLIDAPEVAPYFSMVLVNKEEDPWL